MEPVTLVIHSAIFGSLLYLAIFLIKAHNHINEHLDRQVAHLERFIALSVQDSINAVVLKLGKAKEEIVAKIADIQAQLDAANIPAEVVDLSALEAAAQSLDDIVPDVEEPAV